MLKTSALYGCLLTLATAIFTLIMYFIGAHSDPEKMNSTALVGGLIPLAIGITILILGIRARRAEVPLTEGFGYGAALATGIMIGLVAAVTGTVFQYLYENFINPNFVEVQMHAQSLKLAAKGVSDSVIEKREAMMQIWNKPIIRAAFVFLFISILNTILALICAAFCTRANPDEATSL